VACPVFGILRASFWRAANETFGLDDSLTNKTMKRFSVVPYSTTNFGALLLDGISRARTLAALS
jgi:hypothetical protein